MDNVRNILMPEAARLEDYENIKSFATSLRRKHIVLVRDPENARRKLVPVSALSPKARQKLLAADACEALQKVSEQSILTVAEPANSPQRLLAFAVPSQTEKALLDAAPPALPAKYRAHIERWAEFLGDCIDGAWKKYLGHILVGILIENHGDYLCAQSRLRGKGFSQSKIFEVLARLKAINHDPSIPASQKMAVFWGRMLPKNRSGRSGHAFFDHAENLWMAPKLLAFYLNQAKPSVKRAHEVLIAEIDDMQRKSGDRHIYHKPTLSQCRTFLKSIDLPTLIYGREGEKKFDDKCGKYISRDASTLRANDLWVTDQRLVDVRLRDGGEHLGRIWMVTFLDVSSDKVLGYAFGPILSSDVVMTAAAMAIERHGVPRAIQMDLGKEFTCKAFNGTTSRFSGKVLYREAQGFWNLLGVKIVKAIGRNAKTKTIERLHREVTEKFDKRFAGYTGSNTDERPEKLADEERQHLEWLGGNAQSTPLVKIGQYIQAFILWAEGEWNNGARGKGKMRQGMTPNEAFNVKAPVDGFRTISPDELDRRTAEHRVAKIQRGGQINLTFFGQQVEYEAPELFKLQGKEVEVIISRRTFRCITVLYPVPGGIAPCVATLKPQLAWLPENRDELRAAMRCKAAVHRAIRRGSKASRLAILSSNPVELLEQQKALPTKDIIGAQKFFADTSQQSVKPEAPVGFSETVTASAAAARFIKAEREEPEGIGFADLEE
jgi:hypothetical protein